MTQKPLRIALAAGLLVAGLGLKSQNTFALEDAKTLPPGIFRVYTAGAVGRVENRFDSQGNKVNLASDLSGAKPIGQQVLAADPDLKNLQDGLNLFEQGLGDSFFESIQSEMNANAQANFQNYVAAMEYGLTENLSLGVIVPITSINTKGSFSANTTSTIDEVRARVAGTPLEAGLDQLQSFLPSAAETTAGANQEIFLSRGYQAPTETTATGLGDIEVGAKYRLFNVNNERFRGATKFGVRLPTASHRANQAQVFDASTGDRQTDLAAQYIMEWLPTSNWTLATAVMGTVQLPATEERYVKRAGDNSPLPPDLNDDSLRTDLRRNLGNYIDVQAGTKVDFFERRFSPSVAYNFRVKSADRYTGSTEGLNYAALGANSSSHNHGLELAATYSTLTDFRNNDFFMPLEATLAYNNTFAGRNVRNREYVALTLKAYF